MKKLVYTFLVQALSLSMMISCSSKPAANKPVGDQAASESASVDGSTPKATSVSEAAPQISPVAQLQKNLDQAVDSQISESVYRSAVQLLIASPNNPKANYALGVYYFKRHENGAALLFLDKVLASSGGNSEISSMIYNSKGLIALDKNDNLGAITNFKKAFELNSDNAEAAANIAGLYIEGKDYTKALLASEIAIKKYGSDVRVLNNYAVALAAQGKHNLSKDVYQKALKIQSNNKDLLFNYAVLLVDDLSSYKEGQEMIDKLNFVGVPEKYRRQVQLLESKATAGVK